MAHADSPSISFVDALWPAHGAGRGVRAVLLVLLGSALLTLSAKLQVPFYPVPMTMQTVRRAADRFAYSPGPTPLKAALAFALALGGAAMVRRRLGV